MSLFKKELQRSVKNLDLNVESFVPTKKPDSKPFYSKKYGKAQEEQSQSNNSPQPRYFVIKSIDEDNIHKSIKFGIWCSTMKGNQKLQKAFREAKGEYPIYLLFSVNGSGRFLGVAQMTSDIDYNKNFNYWSQDDKWRGFFMIKWLVVKDVPNKMFKHIFNP